MNLSILNSSSYSVSNLFWDNKIIKTQEIMTIQNKRHTTSFMIRICRLFENKSDAKIFINRLTWIKLFWDRLSSQNTTWRLIGILDTNTIFSSDLVQFWYTLSDYNGNVVHVNMTICEKMFTFIHLENSCKGRLSLVHY